MDKVRKGETIEQILYTRELNKSHVSLAESLAAIQFWTEYLHTLGQNKECKGSQKIEEIMEIKPIFACTSRTSMCFTIL